MKNKSGTIQFLLFCMFVLLPLQSTYGQLTDKRALREISPLYRETVSMASSLSFKDALDEFNDIAKRKLGKVIVDPYDIAGTIELNVDNMNWLDALESVLRNKGFEFEEYSDHFLIKKPEDLKPNEKLMTKKELFETREVMISAVFFEANVSKIRKLGSSWSLTQDNSNFRASMTAGDNQPSLLQLSDYNQYDFYNISNIFKALESKQLGDIIASPQVTVRSHEEGRIQIGSDFSVTVQDFAGNTVSQFFSTGSIIKVTPEIISYDSTTFINISLDVQKSSASNSELGTEIKKTSAQTAVLLLDGEETLIGGLYSNEESITREGLPFLKDLPWWFFGLRYVFGFDSKNYIRKELLILLKAELTPSLSERIVQRRKGMAKDPEMLRETLLEYNENLEYYLDQNKKKQTPKVADDLPEMENLETKSESK